MPLPVIAFVANCCRNVRVLSISLALVARTSQYSRGKVKSALIFNFQLAKGVTEIIPSYIRTKMPFCTPYFRKKFIFLKNFCFYYFFISFFKLLETAFLFTSSDKAISVTFKLPKKCILNRRFSVGVRVLVANSYFFRNNVSSVSMTPMIDSSRVQRHIRLYSRSKEFSLV